MNYSAIKDYFYQARFMNKLKAEATEDCRTVLDIGCGRESPIKNFSDKIKYSLGVDCFRPYINYSKKLHIHSEYILSDVFMACKKIKRNAFDCVLLLDIIEHLKRTDGLKLIKEAERIAVKKVIIYTPNGFLKQEVIDNNPGQEHLSGWSAGEMENMGYKVFGMSGLKYLRGERGEIRFHPKFFWQLVASASQIFTYRFPGVAFQLFCVKKIL